MMPFIPLISYQCAVNIQVILEETKWIQAKYHKLTCINSLISPIISALKNFELKKYCFFCGEDISVESD